MKRLIGILLLCLMATQLLPIKEVGKILFNNQIVEEHPADGCSNSGDNLKFGKEIKFFDKNFNDSVHFNPQLFLSILQYHLFEDIPNSPAQEIHTPPPNTFRA